MKKNDFSSFLIYTVVLLSPLFFIPTSFTSLDFAKNSIIVLGLILAAILQIVYSFKEKKIDLLPKTFLISISLLSFSIVLSALFSPVIVKSLFGQGFELNTASFLLAILLAICVTYRNVIQDTKKSLTTYVLVIASFLVLSLYHLSRIIFGADFLDFGIFTSLVSSPIGSWVDFGIFSALVLLLSLSALKLLNIQKNIKISLWLISVLSAFFIVIINTKSIVISLAVTLFIVCLYFYKNNIQRPDGSLASIRQRIPWLFAFVFIIVLVLGSQGYKLTNKISTSIGTSYSDVSLTWRSTLDIVTESVKVSPMFGIGENNFVQAYTAFKPASINQTDLWSMEFNRGYSWFSTFVATQGFLGLLTWILFFVLIFKAGKKIFSTSVSDPINRYVMLSSYFASVFLWLTFLVYTPGAVILFLSAVFTGIFIASTVNAGIYNKVSIDMDISSRKKIIKILLIVVLILLAIWGIFGLRKIVGMMYFSAGVKHMTVENSLDKADMSFSNAIATDNSNIYWQARAEVAMAQIRQLISSVNAQTSSASTSAIAVEAGKIANNALNYSEKAIELDPYNYYNYVSKARVGELANVLSMENAKDVVIESYKQAISINNTNPEIYLSLARFLASQKMYDEAMQVIGSSLNVKNNYLDAIYLLSQIQAEKGDLKNAIISAKVATEINPNNPLLFFQLGILEYSSESYSGAVTSLEKAVSLSSDYANARYFLGLSYARIGKNAEAITQFEALSKSNPENQEVSEILTALMAGKNIFKAAEVDNAEKSPKLPIGKK